MSRNPPIKPTSGDVTIGSSTFQRMPLPSHQWFWPGSLQMMTDHLLCAAAKHAPQSPAHQRVRRTRRQANPPRNQVPNDGSKQGTNDDFGRDDLRIHQAGGNGFLPPPFLQCSGQISDGCQYDRLARTENFGRNDGGNGIGGVVEAVDVFKHQRHKDDDQNEGHRRWSGILQDDVHYYVTHVTAAVHHLLDQFVKITDGPWRGGASCLPL